MNKLINSRISRIICSLVMAMSFMLCLNDSIDSIRYSNSIVSLFVFAVIWSLFEKAANNINSDMSFKGYLPYIIFNFLFFGSLMVGSRIENEGNVNFAQWYLCAGIIVLSIGFAPILYYLVEKLNDLANTVYSKCSEIEKKIYFSFFLKGIRAPLTITKADSSSTTTWSIFIIHPL